VNALVKTIEARVPYIVLFSLTIVSLSCQPSQPPASEQAPSDQETLSAENHPVLAVLEIQEKAWNDGDIEEFMEYYWKSEDLTFSFGGNVTRGWQQTLDRYRERYPTPDDMGETHFKNLEVFPLGDSAALVLGEYYLAREMNPLQGYFSVVFRNIDSRWVVIHDHTSQDPDEKSP